MARLDEKNSPQPHLCGVFPMFALCLTDLQWIANPLDASVPYSHTSHTYCLSLYDVWVGGEIVFAICFDDFICLSYLPLWGVL